MTMERDVYKRQSQEKPCWTLHVRDDKDEWQDVVLPTADKDVYKRQVQVTKTASRNVANRSKHKL